MRKLLCYLGWGLLALALVARLMMPKAQEKEIIVTAKEIKNPLAQGSDIVVSAVEVDGERVDAVAFFEDASWIKREDGSLYWRSFDQPEGMIYTISGSLTPGSSYRLVLNASKWHGICNVSYDGHSLEIDEYKDVDSEDYYIELGTIEDSSNRSFFDFDKLSKVLVLISIVFFLYNFIAGVSGNYKTYSGRKLYIDILKNISAFNVVILHCTCGLFDDFHIGNSDWLQVLGINCITTFAVPLFFMISGALLIDDDISIKNLLFKRLPGVYIPLLVWNSVYIVYRIICGENISFIRSFLVGLYSSQYYHLWFMYTLIGIYISLPVLSKLYILITSDRQEVSTYFFFVLLILPLIINTLFACFGLQGPYLWFAFGAPELALLVSGRLLAQNSMPHIFVKKPCEQIRNFKVFWGSGVLMALLMTIVLTSFVSKEVPSKVFFGYAYLPVFLYAFCIFGFFKSIEHKLIEMPKFFQIMMYKLSDVSIGIYFMHMLIYGLVKTMYSQLFSNVLSAILMAVIIYFVSAFICFSGIYFPGYIGKCFGRSSRSEDKKEKGAEDE